MLQPTAVAAPPSSDVLAVLSGLLHDAILLVERGTATLADVDVAMRLGAGHPAGPFEVLASLPADEQARFGLTAPSSDAAALIRSAGVSAWTGLVGVAGTGHMAGGIVETVARSGRPVRVLARSAASGERLLGRVTASLDRAVSRGRLDENGRATCSTGSPSPRTQRTWRTPTS